MIKWIKNIFNKTEAKKEEKVFTVDTGNLPPEKAAEVVNKVKEEKTSKPAPKKRGRPKKKTS